MTNAKAALRSGLFAFGNSGNWAGILRIFKSRWRKPHVKFNLIVPFI